MAQSIVNSANLASSSAGATQTLNLTVSAGVSRKAIFGIVQEVNQAVTGATFDGNAMTFAVSRTHATNLNIRAAIYTYDIPDIVGAGTYAMVVSYGASVAANTVTMYGWQTAESLAGAAESTDSSETTSASASLSNTLTSSASAIIFSVAVNSSSTPTWSFSGDVTERSENNEANYTTASADGVQGSGGSKTATATASGTATDKVLASVSIAQALLGPIITVQPANDVGIISNGQSTVYTTTATGSTISALTWKEDGASIADGGVYDIVTTGIGTGSVSSTLTITRTSKTNTPWDIKANVVDANGNTDTNTVTDTWWTGPVLTTFPATNGSGVSTATLTCDYVTGVGEAIEVRIPLSDGDVAVTVTTT